jgi:hypothetical protein
VREKEDVYWVIYSPVYGYICVTVHCNPPINFSVERGSGATGKRAVEIKSG